MRLTLFILLTPFLLSAAEPSAFGAGNLDSPNPYGLTETEKQILSNRKTLDTIEKKTFKQLSRVESIQERVDGLQTIVEGINEKSQSNAIELKQLQSARDLSESERIAREKELSAQIAVNTENITQLKKVLTEFSQLIDTINANYVSKEEFNRLVEDINGFKSSVGKSLKSVATSGNPYSGLSSAEISDNAYKHYQQKEYTTAIEEYTYLIEKNYKPARAHYMIGEMWYYRSEFGKALSYFKESAKLYDKASYMPTLMLHSAVCMEKTGDSANAKAFLNALIATYPDDKIAIEAQKRLDKLK